jgi:hypothetical protein
MIGLPVGGLTISHRFDGITDFYRVPYLLQFAFEFGAVKLITPNDVDNGVREKLIATLIKKIPYFFEIETLTFVPGLIKKVLKIDL